MCWWSRWRRACSSRQTLSSFSQIRAIARRARSSGEKWGGATQGELRWCVRKLTLNWRSQPFYAVVALDPILMWDAKGKFKDLSSLAWSDHHYKKKKCCKVLCFFFFPCRIQLATFFFKGQSVCSFFSLDHPSLLLAPELSKTLFLFLSCCISFFFFSGSVYV